MPRGNYVDHGEVKLEMHHQPGVSLDKEEKEVDF